MATQKFKFKRGDTFLEQVELVDVDVPVTDPVTPPDPIDMTGWTVKSEVRDPKYLLLSELECEWIDQAGGVFVLKADDTTHWPYDKELVWDIEYTTDTGQIVSTDTVIIACIRDVTEHAA